jgi:glycosyltransferase involved in cell wall biosynthesis
VPASSEASGGRPADALISVIVPVFNEAANLASLFERLGAVLKGLGTRWEIVFVNDGSSDDTMARLRALHAREPAIRIIDLSRNFGKEAALSAGLLYARGDAVVPIDADLQHPPEAIATMVAKWREGYDVVVARRHARIGQGMQGRVASRLFYWLFNRMSEVPLSPDVGDFRLLDRVAVKAINALPERTRFMKGLFAWIGFRTAEITYAQEVRSKGESSLGFFRRLLLGIDGLTAFSNLPLRMWSIVGLVVSMASFLYILYRFVRAAIHGIDVPGYESIVAIMLFLGGLQLLSLGIIAGYIGRVFDEVKNRPLFVVRDFVGFDPPPQ